MATELKLPRLGQGMESGTVVRWLKQEGDRVEKGEPLYEVDTEKVTQEVEADASGVLLKIAVQEGEVPVGQTVAVIGEEGETVSESEPKTEAKTEVKEPAQEEEGTRAPARDEERREGREAAPGMSEQVTELRERQHDGRVKASPLARRIARERGIELGQVRGTGPEGRIVAEDVERAVAAPAATAPAPELPPPGEIEREPLSQVQKTIARRLTEAWQIPVFHLFVSVDMTRALALRERMLERIGEGEVRPTISDILTKIAAAALMRHRAVNALFAGDAIERHPTANIGIAVAIPAGLIVPVIRNCEQKSVAEIAAARADLVERTRSGKARQQDLEGGTFTISNLGMYGVERFTAVLNPPQAAILAVGAIAEKPVVIDGEVVVRPQMDLMLTCDHRTVNGAVGAEFLATLQSMLEEPGLAL